MNGQKVHTRYNTVAFKKAVKDVMDNIPEGGLMHQVHGAGVIGLTVHREGETLRPEVTFWTKLRADAALLMLKEIVAKLEKDLMPPAEKPAEEPKVEVKEQLNG